MTIMLLSIDRYVAVRHPVKSRNFSSTGVVIATALGATWVVAGVIMAPLAAMRSVDGYRLGSGEQLDFCHEVTSLPTSLTKHIVRVQKALFEDELEDCSTVSDLQPQNSALSAGEVAMSVFVGLLVLY